MCPGMECHPVTKIRPSIKRVRKQVDGAESLHKVHTWKRLPASFTAAEPTHLRAVIKEIIKLTKKSRVPTIHETLTGRPFKAITTEYAMSESLLSDFFRYDSGSHRTVVWSDGKLIRFSLYYSDSSSTNTSHYSSGFFSLQVFGAFNVKKKGIFLCFRLLLEPLKAGPWTWTFFTIFWYFIEECNLINNLI